MKTIEKAASWARTAWSAVGLALLFLLAAEAAMRLASCGREPVELVSAETRASLLSKDWGAQALRDIDANPFQVRYQPLVGFRVRPFQSATVNIDADGIRATPQGPFRKGAKLVYAFGGSTMFGTGVPDWGTLPAYLAQKAGRSGLAWRLVNYGNGWWNSTQELVQLVTLLSQGRRPDIAIFYDGINEVDTITEDGGRPGGIAPLAEERLARAFFGATAGEDLRPLLGHARLAQALARLKGAPARGSPASFALPDHEMDTLAAEAVKVYENNVRAATALGQKLGFETYFFLQPFGPITGKPPAGLEARIFAQRQAREREMRFFRKVYAGLRSSPYLKGHPHFKNLETIFDAEKRQIYLDSEHVLPEGNEALAEAMVRFITGRGPAGSGRAGSRSKAGP